MVAISVVSVSIRRELSWRRALLFGGLGIGAVCLIMWNSLVHMLSLWSSVEAYRYAWLVLPFLCYLLTWHYRDYFLEQAPEPSFSGLWLLLPALCLWFLVASVEFRVGEHLTLVLALLGIACCTVGWRIFRQNFGLLALLFFMIPSGDLLPILRWITLGMIRAFALLPTCRTASRAISST